MLNVWGLTPEAWERMQQKLPLSTLSPEEMEELRKKREAEKKIEESGEAECAYCKEDLVKNERGMWESEALIEYCISAKDHKHRPKIVWDNHG